MDGPRLAAGRDAVLAALRDVDDDALKRRPADGGWSAWEVAYHLFDIERWHIAKLCEAAAPDAAGALGRFMAVWSDMREAAIRLAAEVPAERLDTAGLLGGVPEWTPRALIDMMVTHDLAHAAQIRATGERAPSDSSPSP